MHVAPASSIIFTGGVTSTKPLPDWSALVGWGGAKEALVRGLAIDLKPIRVNMVVPGAVHTGLLVNMGGGLEETLKGILEMYRNMTLTGAVGLPEDITEAYLWLMKDPGATGNTVLSDSGYLLV